MSSFANALSIVQKLYEEGFTAYFVGGWVRDFLMNRPPDDIDIATNATVAEIQNLFPKTIPVGINFGIVLVVIKGDRFEVATFRKDSDYTDGRRPVRVERAEPEEDAKRRDFTINGMFYDPLQKKLYDYVGGREDLQKGIIRAIGNPHQRFLEDRLRMIRAVRYASRFLFLIENETLKALLAHAESLFPAVAIERVWKEFTKMDNFDIALITLHRLHLLPAVFPSLKGVSIDQIKRRVSLFPYFPEETPLIVKILELLPNSTLEEKNELWSYLKLPKEELHFICFYHKARKIFLKPPDFKLHQWAHFYAHPLYPICLKIVAVHFHIEKRRSFLQEHHMRYDKLEKAITRIQNKTPLLTSHHLRLAGIPNGPKMGALLKEGEQIAIDENLDHPEEVLKRLDHNC